MKIQQRENCKFPNAATPFQFDDSFPINAFEYIEIGLIYIAANYRAIGLHFCGR